MSLCRAGNSVCSLDRLLLQFPKALTFPLPFKEYDDPFLFNWIVQIQLLWGYRVYFLSDEIVEPGHLSHYCKGWKFRRCCIVVHMQKWQQRLCLWFNSLFISTTAYRCAVFLISYCKKRYILFCSKPSKG